MKVEKREGNVVVLDYGHNVGVKYDFNNSSSRPSIDRTLCSIIAEPEIEPELKLAKSALKMASDSLEVAKVNSSVIEMIEIVGDDNSLKTIFDFSAKMVSKVSLDNSVGKGDVNPDISFTDYAGSVNGKAKLEIAKQARALIIASFRF